MLEEDGAFVDESPPARGRLCSAVLATLFELGPSPTAFKAAPSADFLCDGTLHRTAPGWWVVFAAALEVKSSPADERQEELVELRFHDAHVHNGEPFAWLLSMATDVYGVRRCSHCHCHSMSTLSPRPPPPCGVPCARRPGAWPCAGHCKFPV